jgi:hypothetical protein
MSLLATNQPDRSWDRWEYKMGGHCWSSWDELGLIRTDPPPPLASPLLFLPRTPGRYPHASIASDSASASFLVQFNSIQLNSAVFSTVFSFLVLASRFGLRLLPFFGRVLGVWSCTVADEILLHYLKKSLVQFINDSIHIYMALLCLYVLWL